MIKYHYKEKRSVAAKRRRTLIVLPSSPDKKIVTISLPSLLWFALCVAVFVVPLLAAAGLWSFHRHHRLAMQAHRLEVNNRALRSEIQEQNKKMESLSGKLIEMREKANLVQKFLGLNGDGEQRGTIGQGGLEISPENMVDRLDCSQKKQPPVCTGVAGLRSLDLHRLDKDFERIIGRLEERQERLDTMPSISPVNPKESWISSSFGMRISPFTGRKQFHPGIDIAGSKGTPIMAPAKGRVTFVGRNGSLGLCLEIEHNSSLRTTYGHLLESTVKKGRQVQRGEIIGYMGDSGRSTGYHLHYEIEKQGKRINPLDYMMDWEKNSLMMAGD